MVARLKPAAQTFTKAGLPSPSSGPEKTAASVSEKHSTHPLLLTADLPISFS
jgi:hypothetical protein